MWPRKNATSSKVHLSFIKTYFAHHSLVCNICSSETADCVQATKLAIVLLPLEKSRSGISSAISLNHQLLNTVELTLIQLYYSKQSSKVEI